MAPSSAGKGGCGTAAASDDLYGSRQQRREDLGAELLPKLFKSVLSAERARTAVFLADLKTADFGWVEVHYDALSPEEILVGRWTSMEIGKTSTRG